MRARRVVSWRGQELYICDNIAVAYLAGDDGAIRSPLDRPVLGDDLAAITYLIWVRGLKMGEVDASGAFNCTETCEVYGLSSVSQGTF